MKSVWEIGFPSQTLNSIKLCWKPLFSQVRSLCFTNLGTKSINRSSAELRVSLWICPWRQIEYILTNNILLIFSRRVLACVACIMAVAHYFTWWGRGRPGYGQPEMGCWVLSPQVLATSCSSTPAQGWQKRQPCWSLGFFTRRGSSSACSFSIRWPEVLQTDSPSGSGEMMAQARFASWSRCRPFKVPGGVHARTDLA